MNALLRSGTCWVGCSRSWATAAIFSSSWLMIWQSSDGRRSSMTDYAFSCWNRRASTVQWDRRPI